MGRNACIPAWFSTFCGCLCSEHRMAFALPSFGLCCARGELRSQRGSGMAQWSCTRTSIPRAGLGQLQEQPWSKSPRWDDWHILSPAIPVGSAPPLPFCGISVSLHRASVTRVQTSRESWFSRAPWHSGGEMGEGSQLSGEFSVLCLVELCLCVSAVFVCLDAARKMPLPSTENLCLQ